MQKTEPQQNIDWGRFFFGKYHNIIHVSFYFQGQTTAENTSEWNITCFLTSVINSISFARYELKFIVEREYLEITAVAYVLCYG